MKLRGSTFIASFIVAIFSSLLIALTVVLFRAIASTVVRHQYLVQYVLNIYILIFFSAFVFFKGSSTAAWLVYRHELSWGYTVQRKDIAVIFALSCVMALVVFGGLYVGIKTAAPILGW